MKATQVEKLYAKLTPHEQATLAVEALARQDESEIDAIIAAVPRQTFTGLHTDYTRRAHGLLELVCQYSIEYWKNNSFLFAALALYNHDGSNKNLNLSKSFDAKLMAMDIALAEVCRVLKVDIEAIKHIATCKPQADYEEIFDMPADAELVAQYVALFTKAARLD
jgi:hypothetical protein